MLKIFNKKCEANKSITTEEQKVLRPDDVKIAEINPYRFRHVEINRRRINLLIPSINPEHVFGGISTAIKFYLQLANALGYDQRIILVDALPSKEALEQYSDYILVDPSEDSDERKQIVSYALRQPSGIPVSSTDYFMLTGWWTAHCIDEAYNTFISESGVEPNPYIYFIQDFEPGFYAWSTKYMLADATYRMKNKVIAIFNTKLLNDYFDKNDYSFWKSFSFEPTLNKSLKEYLCSLPNKIEKKKQIIVYGRPSTDRNAFSLVIAALNKWANSYDKSNEWTILSAGEQHTDIVLDSGLVVRSVGKLSINEYANMLEKSYCGVSLMVSPHPSYPPLEMASFGVRVVTNCYANKDLKNFNEYVVSLKAVTPLSITEELTNICNQYTESIELPNRNTEYLINSNEFAFVNQIRDILE